MSSARTIFLASFLGLFVELALIRWVSCEIRVFAYCKNLVLVASFLGFGLGLMRAEQPVRLVRAMFLLLLLVMVVHLPWESLDQYGPRQVSTVLARLSGGLMIFNVHDGVTDSWSLPTSLAFTCGWTALLFVAVALIMVPFGQITGLHLGRIQPPLTGYSWNVAGSLAGILGYTAFTAMALPPLLWFAPVVVAAALLDPVGKDRLGLLGVGLAIALALLPNDTARSWTVWSSYQKLQVLGERNVIVNNIAYQAMREQRSPDPNALTRWTMPYAARRPGDVLIVGAGTGNDASAALAAGAKSVTAIEIDSEIYDIGIEHHPDIPYSHERVEVVIDDARHYLRTTDRTFDVIVFSHLDSHNQLSSYTNVRLDDYIYTVESLTRARTRLSPGGYVYLSFFAELPFIGPRLERNLTEAFGHSPVALEEIPEREDIPYRMLAFLIGEEGDMAGLRSAVKRWKGHRVVDHDVESVQVSTDDWPFLPLEKPSIPPVILLISCVILVVCGTLVWKQRPRGESFDGRLFWLGAAFMLLEVHNVSRLALLFGTTWHVNAWVIAVILSLILVANAVVAALVKRGQRPGRWAVVGLFATLLAAWGAPLEWFSFAGGPALATLLLSAPIFFAGLVFAEAFNESASPTFALGWNVLGALTGGLAESVSFLFGMPSLVVVAAAFYALALASKRPASAVA